MPLDPSFIEKINKQIIKIYEELKKSSNLSAKDTLDGVSYEDRWNMYDRL